MALARKLLGLAHARWIASEKTRFVVVGVYNTAFGYATFAVLYLLAGQRLHYLVLVLISHCCSVTNAFIGHRHLTFGANGSIWVEFIRFNASYLGLLGIAIMLMPIAIETLGLHPLLASAAVTLIGVIVSYFVHRNFTFRRNGAGFR